MLMILSLCECYSVWHLQYLQTHPVLCHQFFLSKMFEMGLAEQTSPVGPKEVKWFDSWW